MKNTKYLFLLLAFCILAGPAFAQKKTVAEKHGWNLSMQSYTLHLFSVVESLEKTRSVGLKFIEIYPGQKMGEGFGDAVFGYDLTDAQQKQLLDLAKSKGIKIISSGVWVVQGEEWAKVFEFAKKMKLKFITAEPARNEWDIVEKYAKQYNIQVSTHNHPNVDSYWKPEILLNCIASRSKLLGSCADVGHFKRMNIDEADAIKRLDGRIISLHMKDITLIDDKGTMEDVVWGTGSLKIKEMLKELKRQNFKGYFTIEYEANWEDNLQLICTSIDNFNKMTEEIFAE